MPTQPLLEPLDPRLLLANLTAVSIHLVDQHSGLPVTNPAPGQAVTVRGTYHADALPPDGVAVRVERVTEHGTIYNNATLTNGTSQTFDLWSWAVPPGPSTIRFRLDPDAQLAESSDADNEVTLQLDAGPYLGSGLPDPILLHSLPTAQHAIYLDFNGHFANQPLGGYSRGTTPAFTVDKDPTSFSPKDVDYVRDLWARVAEDFAPFAIDVTTEEPAPGRYLRFIRICVGGSNLDWYILSASGVSNLNTFSDPSMDFTGYAFGVPHADTISHEAGHALGLKHQSDYGPDGKLRAEYGDTPGTDGFYRIMGQNGFGHSTWWNGTSVTGPTTLQDDMAVIASPANGFGYRPDDVPDDPAAAKSLGSLSVNSPFSSSAIVGRNDDADAFSFVLAPGLPADATTRIAARTIGAYANLRAVLTLLDSAGNTVATAQPDADGNATLDLPLAPGAYTAVVRSTGVYGRIGQYTLEGAVVRKTPKAALIYYHADPPPGPDGSGAVPPLDFGTYLQKSKVKPVRFFIRNDGTAPLTLTTPTAPPGFAFTIAPPTTIAPGQSAPFSIRLLTTAVGRRAASLVLATNDPLSPTLTVPLRGVVVSPSAPDLRITLAPAAATRFPAGQSTRFTVGLYNVGLTRAAAAKVSIQILASRRFSDPPNIPIKTTTHTVSVASHSTQVVALSFNGRIPRALAAGRYYLWARVTSSLLEINPDNNTSSAIPIRITAPPA